MIPLGDGWQTPRLQARYPDPDCGCPVEEWIYWGIELTIHFEPDGSVEVFADGGEWDMNVPLAATTVEAGRNEAFEWVRSLPMEK